MLYEVKSWASYGDDGYRREFTSRREAMKYAAAECRQLGGRGDNPKARPMYRQYPHEDAGEIARWALSGTSAGVVVYSA
mgnify:CR=1 FL=1